MPYGQGHERQDLPQALASEPEYLHISCRYRGLFMIILPSASHCLSQSQSF